MSVTELIIAAAGLFIGYFIVSNLLSRDTPEDPAKEIQAMTPTPAERDDADNSKSP